MKIFKQILGFMIILAILLLWKPFITDFFQIDTVQWYSGIIIPWEDNINENMIDLGNFQGTGGVVADNSWEAGITNINNAIYYVIGIAKYILYAVALVYIVIAGLRIVTAQGDETRIKNNKDTIVFALFGFVVILLADTAVKYVFYGGAWPTWPDMIGPGECLAKPEECATRWGKELMGIVSWGKTLLAVIAVVEIIMSGIRLIMAIGEEDIIEKEKKVFIWVGIGLLILAINELIINKVLYVFNAELKVNTGETLKFTPDYNQGVIEFVGVIQFILQFVGVIALASIVYAGFLILLNFWNDEKIDKAKWIIRDAVIGIIVAFSAYAIISTIVLKAS